MNKVVLIGRLTKDPEVRFTQSSGTAVTRFTLAVDRFNSKTNEKEADFIPVVVWGKAAENVANYLSKGSQAAVSGRIQTSSYDAKDGTKRYVTEVVADAFGGVQFLGAGKSGSAPGNNFNNFGGGYQGSDNNDFNAGSPDLEAMNDDDMPF